MPWRWLVIALTACGRAGFDPLVSGGGDASIDAPLGPFSAPMPIAELNSTDEDDDPTLTDDMLEIYFSSTRPGSMGTGDIWRATRPTIADTWSQPLPVAELNTSQLDVTPEIAPDGLTIWLSQGSATNRDIYVSTRATRSSTWSLPTRVAELSSGADDTAAAPSPDLLAIVLTRGSVTVDAKLFLATRATGSAVWNTPTLVLDDPTSQEDQAWLGPGAIYFTVNTPGLQTIYEAPRTGPATFGPRTPVPGIDLAGDESDPWLESRRRVIVFEHENDLYMASR